MTRKIRSGHIIVDRDQAEVLKSLGMRSQSVVEFDLVWDAEAGKGRGDYTEIIVRLGSEEMSVEINGKARWFWLEFLDTINEIAGRAGERKQDAA